MEQKEELECAQRKHDEQKMELIRTLNELNKRLDEKEKLMHNMQESDGMISQLRTDYEVCVSLPHYPSCCGACRIHLLLFFVGQVNIAEKESTIGKLQQEKEELEDRKSVV